MGSGEGRKWEQKSKGTRLLFIIACHPIKTSSQQSFFYFLLTSTAKGSKKNRKILVKLEAFA